MNSALYSKGYFSRYFIALVCFLFIYNSSESYGGYNNSIRETLAGIKEELKKSKSRALAHEKAIKSSKINILALTDQERKLEKQLKQLKYKSAELTIILQKIASQPIFNSFLSPNKSLSTARSINLINFLRDELTTAKVRLNAKLAESNILKSKINLERNRFEKTARGLTLLNKKLTSLITRQNFISNQQSLNDVADEVRLENLSTDLQRLLLKLKNGNLEKDSFIKKLEQLSKNTVYKQPFSRSIKPETTSITQGPLSKGYQNKKSNGKKVGFLSPRSFLKNKHNVGLPVKGKIVKLFGQTDPIGLTTKGITISTRPGAHVVASFDGRVIYAGPFRTYGNILIIDHGEGFSTLLVGLGYIGVKTEQVILGGEPVGKMETGPLKNKEINQKLYIELRKHGKPIDPMAWMS
jgi:septal ring factor EnvC (AmiA/AmiB activator)